MQEITETTRVKILKCAKALSRMNYKWPTYQFRNLSTIGTCKPYFLVIPYIEYIRAEFIDIIENGSGLRVGHRNGTAGTNVTLRYIYEVFVLLSNKCHEFGITVTNLRRVRIITSNHLIFTLLTDE